MTSATGRDGSWGAARVIAGYGLPSRSEDVASVTPRDWTELITVLSGQRLCGVAVQAAEAGVLELTRAQYDELLDHHEMQLALDLRVERLVLLVFEALSSAGVDARLLKGPSTSRRFYDDPSLRSFGDADVLVPRNEFRRATGVLEALGWSRKTAPPRPWFDRYVKAACFTTQQGLELDLHQMLAPGPYGLVADTNVIFECPADHVAIGAARIACLPAPFAFVHACIHAVLGDPSPRFVSLRDVIAILHADPSPDAVTQCVECWELEAVVARALSLAASVLSCHPDNEIARRYAPHVPSRRDEWRLSLYETDRVRSVQHHAATFWELESLADKIAYAAALAVPGREYVHARGTTYPRRLRDAVTLALQWRPR